MSGQIRPEYAAISDVNSKEHISITVPVVFDGESVGKLYVKAIVSDIQPDILRLLILSVAVFILSSLVGTLVLMIYIDRFVSRPLEELRDACEQTVQTGEYHVANFVSSDRFGEYAQSFNRMQILLGKLTEEKSTLLYEMTDEKNAFEAFLTSGNSAIVVFDQLGKIKTQRGISIDHLIPNLISRKDPLHEFTEMVEHSGTRIKKYFLLEVPSPDESNLTTSYSISFHEIGNNRTAIFVLDITSLRQAEMTISYLQKTNALGELTGGVAHDFNNLLAVIQGNLELLYIDWDSPSRRDRLDSSLEAVKKGANLTNSLLAFAKESNLYNETCNLNDVVQSTLEWTRRVIPASISISFRRNDDIRLVDIDPTWASSAILNLLINARDATANEGTIVIETSDAQITEQDVLRESMSIEAGQYVVLTVQDTGTGIPEEIISRIFDPYFTTKTVGAGSGIGLAMISGFMTQSNGTVVVSSELGIGTTFKLFFPASELKSVETQDRLSIDHANVKLTKNIHVLLVEDEDSVRDVIATQLRLAGYSVTAAENGDKGLAVFKANEKFDVLVSDIMMPGELRGPDLATAIRQIVPDLPVVFLSGYSSDVATEKNQIKTNDYILMKPATSAQLLSAIENAVLENSFA